MNGTFIQARENPLFRIVLWEDLEYRDVDAAELYEDVPFTGIAHDYDTKTGSLVKEKSYWNGGTHGFVKLWYPSGQTKFECRYFHGDTYGELKEWHENGRLKRHEVCWGSEFPLRRKEWDVVGNLINSYYIKDDESNFGYYLRAKKSKRSTLHLRANWASIRRSGLIDFNKRIQIYLFEHPFVGIEPQRDIRRT
jgi:hypothetical protein